MPTSNVFATTSKVTVRALFLVAFGFCALLLLSGRAHALADDPPAATATGSTPPDTAPAATIDTTDSTPPPTVPQSEPTAPTPAGAAGPDDTNTQGATVVTSGTSTANTGSNDAVATAPTTPASTTSTPPATTTGTGTNPTTAPTSNAGATTGSSTAVGDQSTSSINQQVAASTTGNATVDILQIALVVNVGIADSTSGNNAAGATAGGSALTAPGSAAANDTTGLAKATGDAAHTAIVQGAIVTNGQASNQTSTVLNIGIAISNTGLNITIAAVGPSGGATADAAFANVATGNSSATGDRANSSINQTASAGASGNAVVSIDQRAVVVNFGVAISNTGANFSLASLDDSALTPEEQQIIAALLNSLVPILFGSQSAAPGSSTALVSTGGATGVGNATTTTIAQTAQATASGSQSASVAQTAQVANFGIALANSGFNASLAGSSTGAADSATQLAQAESSLDSFFANLTDPSWLQSANPFAAFAQTVEIDGVTFDLGGSLSANDMFVGFDSSFAPEENALPNGVHVRQVSGVLNIGIATSDSGDNTVVSSVNSTGSSASANVTTADRAGRMVLPSRQVGSSTLVQRGMILAQHEVAPTQQVLATVVTNDATSIGNHSTVGICQSFNDTVCDPPAVPVPVPPAPPAQPPATPPVITVVAPMATAPAVVPVVAPAAEPASATAATGTLPFTGSSSTTLAGWGAVLLAVGAVLSRRRRRTLG